MHGHEPIIAMRKAGRAPAIVFIQDFPSPEAKDWHNPGARYREVWAPDHATVCTDGDVIQLQDWRFLIGLRVSVTSANETRAKALFAAIKAAKASVIAACHSVVIGGRTSSGWTEIYHRDVEFAHG